MVNIMVRSEHTVSELLNKDPNCFLTCNVAAYHVSIGLMPADIAWIHIQDTQLLVLVECAMSGCAPFIYTFGPRPDLRVRAYVQAYAEAARHFAGHYIPSNFY